MNNFQRDGAESNSHVGSAFEVKAQRFFASQGLELERDVAVFIGIAGKTKPHKFDLGSHDPKTLVECKSHTWTESENIPSAKITTWNEAMYMFHAAPSDFRKVLFVLKHYSKKHRATLAEYYLRTHEHLIPEGVEIWEFDEANSTAFKIR